MAEVSQREVKARKLQLILNRHKPWVKLEGNGDWLAGGRRGSSDLNPVCQQLYESNPIEAFEDMEDEENVAREVTTLLSEDGSVLLEISSHIVDFVGLEGDVVLRRIPREGEIRSSSSFFYRTIDGSYPGYVQMEHYMLSGVLQVDSMAVRDDMSLDADFSQTKSAKFMNLQCGVSVHDAFGTGAQKNFTVESGTFQN